ncbi:MAG: MarR family transcriptional regulator [Rhodospirillaceae bacterium]|jgi:MarR family transcriptional regulator, lower aerobic nicotinate degradation pathway regulator|nr:MarR family transcriptional regulator [Rhodospirillaceae bacterium]
MANQQSGKKIENLAELYDRPGFLLRRCQQETGFVFEESCAELGLTVRQYDFLFVLSTAEARDQDQLARLLGLDRSNTGHVVRILLRKGLVKRQINPDDKRKRLVSLTEEGKIIFKQAKPAAEAAKDYLLDLLNDEEKVDFMAMLQKIVLGNKRSDRAPLEIKATEVV